MNNYKLLVSLILFFTLSLSLLAQETAAIDDDKLSLNSGTIDNQFEYVIRRSNNYQDYKVIKKVWLYALKAHTIDSINAIQKQLDETKTVIKNQTQEISKLKTSLSATQGTLDKTNTEKDSMSLFGMQMSKTAYNTLLWSLIGGLLALLLFFIYKFKDSNTITRDAKKALTDTEEEFEEHRRVALEREQKVRRQLQDEINKHKSSN